MNTPQYTEQQAQILYDVLVHHNATTLAPTLDNTEAKELNDALAVLRMELSSFIADSYCMVENESYDDDLHSEGWSDGY
jgi:hypothetical protein